MIIDLTKYGFKDDPNRYILLKQILNNAPLDIYRAAYAIFSKEIMSHILQLKSVGDIDSWKENINTVTGSSTLRLAIAVKFVQDLVSTYPDQNFRYDMARTYFMGMKSEFNGRSMAHALKVVADPDLYLVYDSFDRISFSIEWDGWYSNGYISSGLIKYFPNTISPFEEIPKLIPGD